MESKMLLTFLLISLHACDGRMIPGIKTLKAMHRHPVAFARNKRYVNRFWEHGKNHHETQKSEDKKSTDQDQNQNTNYPLFWKRSEDHVLPKSQRLPIGTSDYGALDDLIKNYMRDLGTEQGGDDNDGDSDDKDDLKFDVQGAARYSPYSLVSESRRKVKTDISASPCISDKRINRGSNEFNFRS